jgi:hypothetical protein
MGGDPNEMEKNSISITELQKDLKDTPPDKPTPNGLSNFWHLPAINGICL